MNNHSTASPTSRRWAAVAGALGVGTVVLLTGCSGSSAPAGPVAAPAATRATTQAACAAQLASDWLNMPGLDPDAPAPSATEIQAWAASIEPHLAALRAGVPASVTESVDVLDRTVQAAKTGKPVADSGGSLSTALTAVDAWAHDSCGYTTLDVTNSDGGGLAGVPTSLPAGPVAMKFTNTGDPAKAGFVLLLGKIRDGQTATAADVQSGKTNIEAVADIVAVAQPAGPNPAYGIATLSAGRYIVSAPVGAPPNFSAILATGFEAR
ncbi:hypothetical protein [Pseudofrankia sp. DC12]|uniref:hypothetical protein n=1 Tax=Pseudofrankia sp. DC12 TaxID=683315 RepID=UPI0005F85C91|nr:hypothetical protein [Pseudofrankia sp. DC12]